MKNNSVKFGLLLGAAMLAYWLLRYFIDAQNMFTALDIWAILSILLTIVFMVIATQQTRTAKGGFILFGEAFKVSFLTYAIATFIATFCLYVLINFIDTSLKNIYIQASISMSESMMRFLGTPEDVIMDMLTQAEENVAQVSFTGFSNFLLGSFQALLFFGLPVSAIIGAILKKKAPVLPA